jgi:hypothetical protein
MFGIFSVFAGGGTRKTEAGDPARTRGAESGSRKFSSGDEKIIRDRGISLTSDTNSDETIVLRYCPDYAGK